MLRRLALLCLIFSSTLFAIEFNKYHSEPEIYQYMRDLAHDHTDLVHFYVLGQSDENREVSYITVTKGSEELPAIFFNGTHHGNEWSSTEGILGLMDYLVEHRDDPQVSNLLTHYVFYLEPMVNPDGHFHRTREDAHGVDPNRDYLFPGGSSNAQFNTKIISLMKNLVDSRKFHAAAAYHSGIEEVLWPWCYSDAPTNQKDLFYTFSKRAADAMGFNRYIQSYEDYPTEGEFIDYLFMTQGTFALTYEVSKDFTPPLAKLKAIVDRSVKGALAFTQSIYEYDTGKLHLAEAPRWTTHKQFNPIWHQLGRKLE